MNRNEEARSVTFRVLALFALASVLFPSTVRGQALVINELMSSNGATLLDEDGLSADWIEIHNPGSSSVQLEGHGLSDSTDPFKWVFPSSILRSGEHLVVFASGKDRRAAAPHWETVIDEGDFWTYTVPTSEPDASWREPGFNDPSWPSGRTGIGYGDGDDRTLVPGGTLSVYARKTFQIDDPGTITHMFLDIDFDDGFVAFINGEEIARENIVDLGRPPGYTEMAITYTEPRLIFGGEPFQYQVVNPQAVLRPGENVLAIQLHNSTPTSSDLTLIPFLTLGMEEEPEDARGVTEIFRPNLSALHTNFKISSAGERVTLTSPSQILLDHVDAGSLPSDISFGRFPDGSGSFAVHAVPTPGQSNSSPGYEKISGKPIFSHEGGFYSGGVFLALSTEDPTGTLYFTLDGSVPTQASARYQSPIFIGSTTVVRARILEDGAFPGETITHTIFVDESFSLPVVSISTNPENFFDAETGIYVLGNNYAPRFPHFGANFWEDWERPVHLELFEPDGVLGFSLDVGAKIFGGWSRAQPQRSLAFFARRQYGASEIRYRIFPEKKVQRFEAFVLRASGQDWQRTHFRDAMMTSLLGDLKVDRQAYRPAVVTINGEYWGIMNLREKVNEHFLASNHEGVDPDQLDLLDFEGSTIHGDAEHYNSMLDLVPGVDTRNFNHEEVYGQVAAMMDIEGFIDYQAAQIYFDNRDWPGNNSKFWRPRTEGGRWRWIMFDTDFGFGLWNTTSYLSDTLAFALEPNGPGWPNPPWSTALLRQLVTNDEFLNDFINRFTTHLNTIFRGDRVVDRINEMAAVLEPEMTRQRIRWGGTLGQWSSEVHVMREFASQRVGHVRSHLTSMFGLSNTAPLDLVVSPPGGGVIEIQGVEISEYPYSGVYFQDIAIKLEARPYPGYLFTGWNGVSPTDQAAASIVLSPEGLEVSASFEIDCAASGSVVINEINYNAAIGSDPGDWVELYNPHLTTADLSGWTFRDELDEHTFTFPEGTHLVGNDYLVLCSDPVAFAAFFPQVQNHSGSLGYSLAGAGELLRLFDSSGSQVDALLYGDESPWPVEADGGGSTLALRNPFLDNAHGPHWAASPAGGTPGSRNTDVFEEREAACEREAPPFLRGDCNDDGGLDLSDAVCIMSWLFLGSQDPGCIAVMNANGDGVLDLSDPVLLLNHLFVGGAVAPVAPFPGCGPGSLAMDEEMGCLLPPRSCRQ